MHSNAAGAREKTRARSANLEEGNFGVRVRVRVRVRSANLEEGKKKSTSQSPSRGESIKPRSLVAKRVDCYERNGWVSSSSHLDSLSLGLCTLFTKVRWFTPGCIRR